MTRRAPRGVARARYLEGDFLLRSGKRRSYYLDKYRFETRPDLLRPLGERIAAAAREHEPDAAARRAGARRGRLAAAASLAVGLPFLIVRKAAKDYGTANRLEGPFEPGECVCLVEDVVTSGGAALEAVEALREAGLVVDTASAWSTARRAAGRPRAARRRLRPLFRAGELLRRSENPRKTAWLSRKRDPGRVGRGSASDQTTGGEQ